MIDNFVFQSHPVRVVFGRKAIEQVPAELAHHNRSRALLLCSESGRAVAGRIETLAVDHCIGTLLLEKSGGPKEALEAFRKLDHDDVDTFLHVGGALGIVDHLEQFEAEPGRPFVSSNAATYWYALRKHGIRDPMPDFGQLLMRTEVAG